MTFGRKEMIAVVAVLAVATLVVVPVVLSNNRRHRREEVPRIVDAIRQAEIDYHDAFGDYVSAEAAPRPPHEVGPDAVPWQPTEGYRKLSFSPDAENVYGSYQVQAESGGFKVVGTCDVDGDGERAVFEATLDEPARPITAAGVF
jgi:hypothetical protein